MTTAWVPGSGNLLEALPSTLPDEVTETLLCHDDLRIERIVSHGQASPPGHWYDQDEHEWVLLLTGHAGLEIEGEDDIHLLGPGDYVLLPAHRRHRVAWTDSGKTTVWLAIFFG